MGIVSISVDVSFYVLLYTQQSSEFDGVEYIKNFSGIWAGVFVSSFLKISDLIYGHLFLIKRFIFNGVSKFS